MISGCKASRSCMDASAPARATFGNRYKWPESDAEFVKSVAAGIGGGGGRGRADSSNAGSGGGGGNRNLEGNRRRRSPAVVDSYSCRQMYLRSYQFSRRKETLQEKTLRRLARVKEEGAAAAAAAAAVAVALPLYLCQKKKENSGGGAGANGDANSKRRTATTVKTSSSSSSGLCCIFRRLLSCAAAVNKGRSEVN